MTHPADETLAYYINDSLPEEVRKYISLHIEHCDYCKRIIDLYNKILLQYESEEKTPLLLIERAKELAAEK